MKRFEYWELEYQRSRYLKHASDADVLDRCRDLLNLLTVITENSKIGVDPLEAATLYRSMLFQHTLTELRLRGIHYSRIGQGLAEQLPPIRWPTKSGPRGWRAVLPDVPDHAIVKYGRLEHLRSLLDGRRVRVALASSYGDPSLGRHRHDDELSRHAIQSGSGSAMQPMKLENGRYVPNGPSVPILGDIHRTFRSDDYYVWCAAGVAKPRLFIDFDADACLVIHDPRAFINRLGWAVADALRDRGFRSLDCVGRHVNYYDPYRVPKVRGLQIDVPWFKPLRYAYQREWRFAAFPYPTGDPLDVLWVNPGPLGDIAEMCYVGELEGPSEPRLLPRP